MYPTVTDMLRDLIGINIPLPIQTFGFFVALAFLCAAYFFSKELQRMERLGWISAYHTKVLTGKPATAGELAIAAVIGFVIGYKLLYAFLDYTAFTEDPQSFILSAEGNFMGGLLGAFLSAWLKKREKDKTKQAQPKWEDQTVHPHELVSNITLIAAVGGLLGAKIFHILEDPSDFMRDPIEALISFSGLTFYGGLIVGAGAVIWYARKFGIPVLRLIDASAPALMLAYGVGRIGCHMAGDGDWGIVNTAPQPGWLAFLPEWMWAFDYPHNVNSVGIPIPGCEGRHCAILPEPVFPTPFYEAVMGILLFAFLWSVRKKLPRPGMVFSLYLVINGLERFFIEKIRVNATYLIGSMEVTQAEIISAVMVLLGIAGLLYFRKRKNASAVHESA